MVTLIKSVFLALMFLFLRQGLTLYPKLTLNSEPI